MSNGLRDFVQEALDDVTEERSTGKEAVLRVSVIYERLLANNHFEPEELFEKEIVGSKKELEERELQKFEEVIEEPQTKMPPISDLSAPVPPQSPPVEEISDDELEKLMEAEEKKLNR